MAGHNCRSDLLYRPEMASSRGARVLLLAWAAVVTVVACQLSSDEASHGAAKAVAPSTSRPSVSSPFDVAAIRTRFHFAFRREDDGTLTAGHASHVVRAQGGGFSLAPTDLPAPGKRAQAASSPSPLVVEAAT